MPNWCRGTLKVRGKISDLKRFVLEGLQPVNALGEKLVPLKFDTEDEGSFSLATLQARSWIWIRDTRRHFCEADYIEAHADDNSNGYYTHPDTDILKEILGIEIDDDMEFPEYKARILEPMTGGPERTLLAVAYAALDDDRCSYWDSRWNSNERVYHYEHSANEELDALYKHLCTLGYEMSDEEKAMQDGTHEVFGEAGA